MTLTPIVYPVVDPVGGSTHADSGTYPASVAAATVDLIEAIGASQSIQVVTSDVHLLGADAHSGAGNYDYSLSPIAGSGTVHSYERWIRLRFTPPFSEVRSFRFWVEPLALLPGWSLKYGVTTTYSTPVNTASAIATSALPTTDPGTGSPNCGGTVRLPGTGVQYSNWIVMQATAVTSTAPIGAFQGFSLGGLLIPVTFQAAWIEN